MKAIERHRQTWQGKSDEWLFEGLDNELKQKVKEIHRLLAENEELKNESNKANTLLSAVLFVENEIQKDKETARLAPESEYKEGYLKAMTNVTAIVQEYLLSKHCH